MTSILNRQGIREFWSNLKRNKNVPLNYKTDNASRDEP